MAETSFYSSPSPHHTQKKTTVTQTINLVSLEEFTDNANIHRLCTFWCASSLSISVWIITDQVYKYSACHFRRTSVFLYAISLQTSCVVKIMKEIMSVWCIATGGNDVMWLIRKKQGTCWCTLTFTLHITYPRSRFVMYRWIEKRFLKCKNICFLNICLYISRLTWKKETFGDINYIFPPHQTCSFERKGIFTLSPG